MSVWSIFSYEDAVTLRQSRYGMTHTMSICPSVIMAAKGKSNTNVTANNCFTKNTSMGLVMRWAIHRYGQYVRSRSVSFGRYLASPTSSAAEIRKQFKNNSHIEPKLAK